MDFINVIKPTHICNLACDYCYNEDERSPIMDEITLERVIEQTFCYVREVSKFSKAVFLWHGGEPLVPGLGFYKKVVSLQAAYAKNVPFTNAIQTNGTLISDAWAKFFSENRFSVGVSLDGPSHINDSARKDHNGGGSFKKVMKAIDCLRRYGINPGVVLTVTKRSVSCAEEIFDFFAQNNLSFQLVELSLSGNAKDNYRDVGITPEEYTQVWTTMFDKWTSEDNPGIDCTSFRNRTKSLISGLPNGCQCLYMCADANISTDPVGDIYTCSTLTNNADCLYGNINRSTLSELMISPVAAAFRTKDTDPHCSACKWFHVCHSGCLSRSIKFKGRIDVRDYYCDSLWKTWDHVAKRLDEFGVALAPVHPNHHFLEFGIDAKHRENAKTPRRVIPVIPLTP